MTYEAKQLAKRHVYDALASVLSADLSGGADYLRALVLGNDHLGYEGPKMTEEQMNHLVDGVIRELRRRSLPRPTVSELRRRA